jgi:hypothetical protein
MGVPVAVLGLLREWPGSAATDVLQCRIVLRPFATDISRQPAHVTLNHHDSPSCVSSILHDLSPESLPTTSAATAAMSVRIDGVAIFWSVFAASWTLLLMAGMSFLYSRRSMPLLRIRGLPLAFAAIALLHVYWVAVQFVYLYGPLVAADIEFWIMGIYLPFGIAVFHASNSRFLHVAKAQRRYAQGGRVAGPAQAAQKSRWPLVDRFRQYDYTGKMLALIFTGMAVQVSRRSISWGSG